LIDLDALEREVEHLPAHLGDFIGWHELGSVRREKVLQLIREVRAARDVVDAGHRLSRAYVAGIAGVPEDLAPWTVPSEAMLGFLGTLNRYRHRDEPARRLPIA